MIAQPPRAYGLLAQTMVRLSFRLPRRANTLFNHMVDTVGLSVVECGYRGESGPSIKGMVSHPR